MDVRSLDQQRVSLFPGSLTMIQAKDMTLFTITSSVLQKASHPKTGLEMRITMKRKIMSEMMTTYFPSLLLMMITYATTFFKPFFFEAALSVNLTTMLVMTTIFISKMEGLPPTSETKMIDMWLILCQLVPFIEVILVTAIEFYNVDKTETEDNDNDMDLVLADLYARKNGKNITMEKKIPENNYVGEEKSGNKATLCTKSNDQGIIVPHLPFIGKKVFQREKHIF